MTSVNSSEELDFRLIFGEELLQGSDPDVRTPPSSTQALVSQPIGQELQNHLYLPILTPLQTPNNYQYPGYQAQGPQYSSLGNSRTFDCPSIQITSIAPNSHVEVGSNQDVVEAIGAEGGCPERAWSRDHLYLSLDPCYRDTALSVSPCSSLSSRSWLSDFSSCESFSHIYDDVEGELNEAATRFSLGSPLTSPLPSPGCGGGAFGVELWQQQYQHPLPFSPSPRQSPSPSPCPSPRTSVTEESWLTPRPTSRSSSRPTSPGGKRRHSSADVHARSPSPHRSPSPTPGHSPRGSVTEDTWIGSPAASLGPLLYSYQELDVPSKTRRTTGTQPGLLPGQGDIGLGELRAVLPYLDSPAEESGPQQGLADLFLPVPSHFSWKKPKPGSIPLFRSSSLPPLDWPLPSQYDQVELKVEVEPRGHHRAHYETEGSRGSIKAPSGGHPVVKLSGYTEQPVSLQVFIGTADERCLRPHAFYQVHRVTGKTVSTACQERVLGGTKVLEIPLLPENNMSASIDCAGILKLRNADIELRKGETDIGRKNTRVRVVFRVNIPQPNNTMLCLQAASIPVECSQRSAQDLPQVDCFSPTSSSVDGGKEMVITGSNLSTQSKVVFMERGPDGRSQWEVDVRVVSEKSSTSSLVVEIPPYHNRKVTRVQVQFYVSNGKRRRSQTQSFTYLSAVTRPFLCTDRAAVAQQVKQEHCDLDYTPHNSLGLCPPAGQAPPPVPALYLDMSFNESCGAPVRCRSYSPLGSSPLQHPPHLQGCSSDLGHQRLITMTTVNCAPSSQTAQHDNQSNSSMRFTDPILANRTVPAKSNMAASTTTGEWMYQSPIRASAQPPPISQHNPLSASPYQLDFQELDLYSSPPHSSTGRPPGKQAPSLSPRRVLTSVDPLKNQSAPHSLFCSAGETLNIKQEHGERLNLQEITLDDVNEIIDRDICGQSGGAAGIQADQEQHDWEEQNSSDVALPFCGGLQ
ncbi:nuclear factor of activated T-cells, cytoplasmic 3-like [Polymixia lowei]